MCTLRCTANPSGDCDESLTVINRSAAAAAFTYNELQEFQRHVQAQEHMANKELEVLN